MDTSDGLIPAPHFQLSCYVGPVSIEPSPFEGWATFLRIFSARPDGFRYAVAQWITNADGTIQYQLSRGWLCWDMYDQGVIDRASRGGSLRAPLPLWTGPSEDALIMKARMLYDRP